MAGKPRSEDIGKENKDFLLQINIEPSYVDLIKVAARRSGNLSNAAWVRSVILDELRSMGLVDADFLPVSIAAGVDGQASA